MIVPVHVRVLSIYTQLQHSKKVHVNPRKKILAIFFHQLETTLDLDVGWQLSSTEYRQTL